MLALAILLRVAATVYWLRKWECLLNFLCPFRFEHFSPAGNFPIYSDFGIPSVFPEYWPMPLSPFFTNVSLIFCFSTKFMPDKIDEHMFRLWITRFRSPTNLSTKIDENTVHLVFTYFDFVSIIFNCFLLHQVCYKDWPKHGLPICHLCFIYFVVFPREISNMLFTYFIPLWCPPGG